MSEFGATGIGVDDMTDEGNHADVDAIDDSKAADVILDAFETAADATGTEIDDITEAEMIRIQGIAALPLGEFLLRFEDASAMERRWLLVAREARNHMPQATPRTVFVPRGEATEAETTRFRAYARGQAASAYKSALAGTNVVPVPIAIIESVKDAVKYISRKLAERIERW